jgi:hypothetical protein
MFRRQKGTLVAHVKPAHQGKIPRKKRRKKRKKALTGVGLEPTLSFPNQEIDIKVNLNLAP